MKARSLTLLVLAEVMAMSLWFISAAILPDMLKEVALSPVRQAALASGVQAGFVIGALASAILGIADRYDPRRVFAFSALCAGCANALLLVVEPGSIAAISARVATGALLAGVYPVGMKIAVGWGQSDRGLLVGLLVGAVTMGTAAPHLMTLAGGGDWRVAVMTASLIALLAGVLCFFIVLGPHHGTSDKFDPRAIVTAWTNRRVRLAYAGYLGHMWELYAMWAWVAAATSASYAASMPAAEAVRLSQITTFVAVAAGAIACAIAGLVADRIGKAEVAIVAMCVSGISALAAAVTFGGPPWITFLVILVWGISIVPDSAQFSALVADFSTPEQAGSLMTLQTALGFALTIVTVQATPFLADLAGWPVVLAGLALGPAFGIVAMARLRAIS